MAFTKGGSGVPSSVTLSGAKPWIAPDVGAGDPGTNTTIARSGNGPELLHGAGVPARILHPSATRSRRRRRGWRSAGIQAAWQGAAPWARGTGEKFAAPPS
jgi:hypothetical protein